MPQRDCEKLIGTQAGVGGAIGCVDDVVEIAALREPEALEAVRYPIGEIAIAM